MARKLTALVPKVLVHLTGCREHMIVNYLRDAAKEWCRETNGWRRRIGTITLGAGADQVAIPSDEYDPITVAVTEARFDRWPLSDPADDNSQIGEVLAIAAVERQPSGSGRFVALSTPPSPATGSADILASQPPFRYDEGEEEGVLEIDRSPYTVNGDSYTLVDGDVLRVTAILQPKDEDGYLPASIVQVGDLAIIDKALAELMAIPNEEWSDPSQAEFFEDRYLGRLGNEKTRIARKRTNLPLRVARSPFV